MSDHKDSPEAIKHPECDIGDFWAYHELYEDEHKLVLVMTVNVGEVGAVYYGPYRKRNSDLFTTVPHRLLGRVPGRFFKPRSENEFGGMLKRGDHRARLTDYLAFSPDAVYEFRIALPTTEEDDEEAVDGFVPRLSFKVVFTGDGGILEGNRKPSPQKMQLIRADSAKGDRVETGDRSGAVIQLSAPGGSPRTSLGPEVIVAEDLRIKLYAGHRQDPFYFDFEGVESKVADQFRKELCKERAPSGGSSAAFSQAFNVSAIVLELPLSAIFEEGPPTKFKVWAATTLDGHPIDRAGAPLFNPTFLPKEYFEDVLGTFNSTRYLHQRPMFAPLVEEQIDRMNAKPSIDTASLLPDVLTIDPAKSSGLPNGRRITADDPTHYWIERLDRGAYRNSGRGPASQKPYEPESPVRLLNAFPYLSAPSGKDRPGWPAGEPDHDPEWPDGAPFESCDCYLDSFEDPGEDHRDDLTMALPGGTEAALIPPGNYRPG